MAELLAVGVATLCGTTFFLLVHVALWRAFPRESPRVVWLFWLAVAGAAFSVFAYLSLFGFDLFNLCAVLWIDGFVFVAYTFFYAGLSRSVSLTLLEHIHNSRHGLLDLDDLTREYAGSARFEDRLRLMDETGLIQLSGTQVRLTAKGRRLGLRTRKLADWLRAGLEG